jgi:CBS-domain-containing membrane protein
MGVTAADLMTSPAVTAQPEASLAEIADLMVSKNISAIPVCKADGTIAGIISEADVVRPFRESARRKRERWLAFFAEGEPLSPDFLDYMRQETKSAADLMAPHVITAGKDATVAQLAELMVAHGVKRIPIVDGGKLIGIVSRSDLLRAIAEEPAELI